MARRTNVDGMREQLAGGLNVAVGGNPGAPALVLVHGLSSTWRVWRPLLPAMLPRRRVIALDLPGFGASPLPSAREYDIEAVAGHVQAALDELGVGEHDLAGHSLGGAISVVYAADRVERVRSLQLYAPAGFLRYPGFVRLAWRSELMHRLVRESTRIGEPLLWASGRIRTAAFRRFIHDPSRFTRRELAWLARDLQDARATGPAGIAVVSQSLFDRLPKLTMPTLLVWGDEDLVVFPHRVEEVAGLLPNLHDVVRFPDTGHLVMWERADELCALIAQLLDEVAPRHPAARRSSADAGKAARQR